jgi:hypothetical protein
MDARRGPYVEKLVYGRPALWAPFYAVGVAARIQGQIPLPLLRAVLAKLQTLHPLLASRVQMERDGRAWLTTADVGEFPLVVRPRVSRDDWMAVFLEQERCPFDFEHGPVTRFFLLCDDEGADLVAVAPHAVCDGYSMTHAMFDAESLLHDPDRKVSLPPVAPTVSRENLCGPGRDHLLLRAGIRVLNRLWPGRRLPIDYHEYLDLYGRYWANRQNAVLSYEFDGPETARLMARCKQQGVAVTGVLLAAFLLAQADVDPRADPYRGEIAVAVNIRNRLLQPPGPSAGLYSSSVNVRLRSRPGQSFWEVARAGHARVHRALEDPELVRKPVLLNDIAPHISDAFIEALATDRWSPECSLLSHFVQLKGTVRWLALSNIGRVELPHCGPPYYLETILPFPPLVPGDALALNVLTVRGRMHLILKFELHQMDLRTAERIRDRALEYIAGAG